MNAIEYAEALSAARGQIAISAANLENMTARRDLLREAMERIFLHLFPETAIPAGLEASIMDGIQQLEEEIADLQKRKNRP